MTSRPDDTLRSGLLPLLARLLLVSEFVIALMGKLTDWSGQAGYMAAHGLRPVAPLLAGALAIELLGSLCLIVGFRARWAAAVMFVYLGIVSVTLHDFWNMRGMAAGGTETQFFKNVGMMGGLLMVVAFGAGRWAVRRD